MPLWSSSHSSASNSSARSSLSLPSSASSSHPAPHQSSSSAPSLNIRSISGPMPKRVQVVEAAGQYSRPVSQAASVLLSGGGGGGGGGGASGRRAGGAGGAGRASETSSRRTSAGVGGAAGYDPRRTLRVDEEVRVVVTEPGAEGEGRFVSTSPPRAGGSSGMKPRDSLKGGFGRKKRFSLFTMDTVAELERAEPVLLWMEKLATTPQNSSDDALDALGLPLPQPDDRPPSLSPSTSLSSTTSSNPAFADLSADEPRNHIPKSHVLQPSSKSGSPTRTNGRLRFFSPSKSGKAPRDRAASDPPPDSATTTGRKFFSWGRQHRSTPVEATIAERVVEEDGEEEDVFAPTPRAPPPQPLVQPHSLGRTHDNATLGIPHSPYDPSLAASTSTATPRASTTLPNNHSVVRFASPSSPSHSSTDSLPPPVSAIPPSHRRTPSEHLDHQTWEFISPSVPTYSQGQRDAPPLELRGTVRRILRPHPRVKMRTSYGTLRAPPPVPTPTGGEGGESAATSLKSGRSGAASTGTGRKAAARAAVPEDRVPGLDKGKGKAREVEVVA